MDSASSKHEDFEKTVLSVAAEKLSLSSVVAEKPASEGFGAAEKRVVFSDAEVVAAENLPLSSVAAEKPVEGIDAAEKKGVLPDTARLRSEFQPVLNGTDLAVADGLVEPAGGDTLVDGHTSTGGQTKPSMAEVIAFGGIAQPSSVGLRSSE